ncbi:hypothetical protein NDU88_002420 [Pleurodeles waltl]|uniref:Uncharacterized protein n=1 Tax=Pleurodeles waltl TaxID=8319 RepID=A0AAV7MNB5_PLEWA|nr:hypothetical protein NDU88_002420 [Pleurodeles waltl]
MASGLALPEAAASGPLPGRRASAPISLEPPLRDTPRGRRHPPNTVKMTSHPRGEVFVPPMRSHPRPGPAAQRSEVIRRPSSYVARTNPIP